MPEEIPEPTPLQETVPEPKAPTRRTRATAAVVEGSPAPAFDPQVFLADLDARAKEHPELVEGLRKNRMVMGIAGELGEKIAQRTLTEKEAAAAEAAVKQRERELMDLAESDPDEFVAHWLGEKRGELAKRELEELKSKEDTAIAALIGHAARDLHEGQELTVEEKTEIANALAGISDRQQMLAAFNKANAQVAARRMARDLVEAEFPERLKAELEAREVATKVATVRSAPAPDLRRGEPTGSGEPDHRADPVAWNKWYESTHLVGRRR